MTCSYLKAGFLSAMLLTISLANPSIAAADLWEDGGFESSFGWNPITDFNGATNSATDGAAPNEAIRYTMIHDNLLTESGKWVEDPTRALEGDRMFWLRPYDDPDTICVGHRFNSVLEAGVTYQLSFNFAAFDEGTPGGSSTLTTKPVAEVTSLNSAGAFETAELVVEFDDGSTADPDNGVFAEFPIQDWNKLTWRTATATFVAPADNGREIYVWASMTNDSNGMLLDGITLRAIPEPAAGMLLMSLATIATLRRRRK